MPRAREIESPIQSKTIPDERTTSADFGQAGGGFLSGRAIKSCGVVHRVIDIVSASPAMDTPPMITGLTTGIHTRWITSTTREK
jgi:hypothetical protein